MLGNHDGEAGFLNYQGYGNYADHVGHDGQDDHDGSEVYNGDEGYESRSLSGMTGNMSDLCLLLRKSYFSNPEPDGFYSGNAEEQELNGLRQDYYSWEWGDALFVVLDPYWHTAAKPGRNADGWNWT